MTYTETTYKTTKTTNKMKQRTYLLLVLGTDLEMAECWLPVNVFVMMEQLPLLPLSHVLRVLQGTSTHFSSSEIFWFNTLLTTTGKVSVITLLFSSFVHTSITFITIKFKKKKEEKKRKKDMHIPMRQVPRKTLFSLPLMFLQWCPNWTTHINWQFTLLGTGKVTQYNSLGLESVFNND